MMIPVNLSFFGGGLGGGGFKGTKGGRYLGRKQAGNRPMSNQAQNKQARSVARELRLNRRQIEELQRELERHDINGGYREILEFAKDWFNIN